MGRRVDDMALNGRGKTTRHGFIVSRFTDIDNMRRAPERSPDCLAKCRNVAAFANFGLRDEGRGVEIFVKHVPEGVFNRRLIIDDLARIILVHKMRVRDRRHRC